MTIVNGKVIMKDGKLIDTPMVSQYYLIENENKMF